MTFNDFQRHLRPRRAQHGNPEHAPRLSAPALITQTPRSCSVAHQTLQSHGACALHHVSYLFFLILPYLPCHSSVLQLVHYALRRFHASMANQVDLTRASRWDGMSETRQMEQVLSACSLGSSGLGRENARL